jgi:hypothetical protein
MNHNPPRISPVLQTHTWLLVCVVCLGILAARTLLAGTMSDDPKGFLGFAWGASLDGSPDLILQESTDRTRAFEPKSGPRLGEVLLESVRLIVIDGQFARVMIRYRGAPTHKQILRYLEHQFGAIDRTPGTTMRGLDEHYNWRGPDTEVNLTYGEAKQQGYLFIESRSLAPRFNEGILDGTF